MSTYFFSYGDDKYRNSKIRIEQEANNSKLFDHINIYGREHLDDEFMQKTRPYVDIPRGGGFWTWKSLFLKKTFDVMKEGDYCVYADAGCTINPHGIERFNQYKKMLEEDSSGILSFRMDGLDEEQYTTEEIFKYFGVENDKALRTSGQIMATILVMRKCAESINLVNDYYNLALNHTHLFSDVNNFSGNCERFIDNRHDQSVLSVLRKKYGTVEIVDETYAATMEGWNDKIFNQKIPFLATRIRG